MDIVSALLTDATYSALCQISYGEYLKNAFESQDYGLDLLTELTVHSANLPFNKCIWIFYFMCVGLGIFMHGCLFLVTL